VERGALSRYKRVVAPAKLSVVRAVPREGGAPAPAPFPQALGGAARTRLHVPDGLDLTAARAALDEGRFSTEYQAIVDARTGRTLAYEALGRFRAPDGRPVPPARMFAVAHADPALLLRLELTLKIHQVEHAPPRAPLFVNLDPDGWARAGDGHRNPFLAVLSSASQRVVVEVTEAMANSDAARGQAMVSALRGRGVAIALDDLGATNGLLSFDALSDAEVLKFDRTLIPRLGHPRARALVEALTRMARETGARTVLEGVETTAEFVLARDLGFDLVQGFLFRDRAQVARAR
jgi:EAL domain-containing protein (putative c-di-GMP-specific phosphodiesterase class I)